MNNEPANNPEKTMESSLPFMISGPTREKATADHITPRAKSILIWNLRKLSNFVKTGASNDPALVLNAEITPPIVAKTNILIVSPLLYYRRDGDFIPITSIDRAIDRGYSRAWLNLIILSVLCLNISMKM